MTSLFIELIDSAKGVNEMVRRRVGFGSAVLHSAVLHQEDHHMQIASIGIDLGPRHPGKDSQR